MDRIGYIVTNNFILIGVDTNLVISVSGPEGQDKFTLRLTDARKVHLLSPTTAVSIVGLPHKASDLHTYLTKLEHTDQTFDEVVTDVTTLYGNSLNSLQQQLEQVVAAMTANQDEAGVIQQRELMAEFEADPALRQLADESLQMVQKNTISPTQFYAFAHEHGKNLYARYGIIGLHAVGARQDDLPVDHFDYVVNTCMEHPEKLNQVQDLQRQLISGSITAGWDNDPDKVAEIKAMARENLTQALVFSNPYKDMKPNIVFYELSAETGFVFSEPPQKLRTVKFSQG